MTDYQQGWRDAMVRVAELLLITQAHVESGNIVAAISDAMRLCAVPGAKKGGG